MNKRLTVLFSLLAVAILLVVLFCTVFLVRKIEIAGTEGYEPDSAKILSDSKLVTGVNIFSVSEKKVTDNIESANPYVKVVKVERKFPDKIIVHVTAREAQFYMRSKNGEFLLLDRELKVLEISRSVSSELTEIGGYVPENVSSDAAGGFLNREDSKYNALRDVVASYEKLTDRGFVTKRFNAFIRYVDLSTDGKTSLSTVDGVKIEIIGTENIEAQVEYSYSFYLNELNDSERRGGVITNEGQGWIYKP